MKKILPLVLTVALLALSGCQGLNNWLFVDDTPAPTPAPVPTVTMTPLPGPPTNSLFGVAWSGDRAVRPLASDNRFDAQWLPLVYEGLFKLDAAFQPRPLLCLYYTTADNVSFLFTLRSDILFHDGTPLTAYDAAWSLNTAKKPGGPYAARLLDMLTARARDDTTLEVVLSQPNPRLPALLTIPVVPIGSDKLDIAPGTGPYVPDMEQDFPHLTPFDGWWQHKRLPLNRLELVTVSSGDQLIYAFESRTLSLVVYNPSDVAGVRFRGDYETWEYDTSIMEFIGFNTARAPLNDPVMRQALAAAVDRDAIGRGGAAPRWMTPALLPIHPENPLYDPVLADPFGFDLTRASSLLAELGYEDVNEDGVLVKTVRRRDVPLELVLVVCVENAHHVESAQRIAGTLAGIGVSVRLEELPRTAYFSALAKGDFDMYYGMTALTADFSPLPFFKDGALGFGGYKDPLTLALWDEAAAETAGAAARQDFWERFLEEAPIAVVAFQRQALLMQRGLTSEPLPTWENLFDGMPEW